jgi:NhaA family Na+:H+ antiporter
MRKRALWVEFAVDHSLVLPVGAAIALVWANTLDAAYARFSDALQFPVNDVGMAFFFAIATKEVVEATSPGGALHPWTRAGLPVVAAMGGMIGPAVVYLAIVAWADQPMLARGWAIPCATDIAFSFLVAKAIYERHPAIPFLLLLAIADDAFGLIVLAIFYPIGELHLGFGAVLMLIAVAVAFLLRRRRIGSFWPYLIAGGTLSWAALRVAGLHPALALVPIVPFLPRAPRDPGLLVEAPATAVDSLSAFEHWWKYPVQAILFFFGLVNAGVPVKEFGTGTWTVLAAVLAGKPLGIAGAAGLAVLFGLHLPRRVAWRDVVVVGCAAAIGFTVALFFATAAFPPGAVLNETKLGALMSVSGAALAFLAARMLGVGRFTASPARRP